MKLRRGWRPAHQLNGKAEVELVLLVVHLDGFEKLEKFRTLVPRHPFARFGNEITFECGYWDAENGRSTEAIYEIRKILANFFVALAAEIDKIHLIDSHNEMANSKKVCDECVTPRLRHDSVSCVDQDDREIAVTCARDEVARVLFVAWRIRNDEFAVCRGEVAIRDVNGDTLFAFRAQAIRQQGKIDAFAAPPFVFSLCAFDLIFESPLCFDEQAADQRGFAVVDVAGRGESKNVTAQKYPSRFLSSMVLAPWSMILVERSLILAEPVSCAISSRVVARDSTAPVHGAQPKVR